MDVQLKKSVLALRINFFFMGVLMGGWSTRIPELKTALKMSDATLGRTLIGSACGAFLISRVIGTLIRELGTKKTFYLGSLVFPLGYLTIAFAPNAYCVFLGIFFFVIGYLLLDNPLTIITQEIERKTDRKYLSGFHGFWSIGTLTAAFFGSFLIGRIRYSIHLTGIAVIVFAVLLWNARLLENKKNEDGPTDKKELPWKGNIGYFVLLIGIGMMVSNSAEFGATDWSALFLRDVLSITGQLYVGAYLAFEIGMILSRTLGDNYIHAYGPAAVIRVCGFVGSLSWLVTMLIGVSIDHFNKPAAYCIILLGYFIAGCGVGPLFPGFITILGNRSGIEMSVALSRAFLISTLGFAFIPATIGFISDATSLTYGMMLPIALLFIAGVLPKLTARFAR